MCFGLSHDASIRNLNFDFYSPARELSSDKTTDDTPGAEKTDLGNEELDAEGKEQELTPLEAVLSERRKALFEPLEPNMYGQQPSAESLLPPPDFDTASYPKGWLIGKKRKLVNVDVVESMRRIAVQEMNRKDREIDGLNVQLEEDARVLEHLQIQLVEEKSKRSNVERENTMLQDQLGIGIARDTLQLFVLSKELCIQSSGGGLDSVLSKAVSCQFHNGV